MIKAGTLRHKIIVEVKTVTKGTAGGEVETWAEFYSPRAEIINKIGNEMISNDKITGKRVVTFKIRYKAGINTEMRVSFNSRYLDIVDVKNVKELNKEVYLTCTETT